MLESFFQKRSKDSRQDIQRHEGINKKKKLNEDHSANPLKKESVISSRMSQDLKGKIHFQ
jgi:hypothetical protein